jgi:glycosyltransferase involved in cell wall biosynthesis
MTHHSKNLVSVIIPTRNRREKLLRCIDSLQKSDYPKIEIVIVDDSSDYDVATDLKSMYPDISVYRNKKRELLSYSRNIGAKVSTGDLLFFLDDDNVVAEDAISEIVGSFVTDGKVGVVSPVIFKFDSKETVWTSYITKGRFPGFYLLGTELPTKTVKTFSFHNSFIVRRDVFEECGRFDPLVFPIHFSELDFAYRVQKNGYIAVVNPLAKDWHDTGPAHMHVDSVRSFYTLRNRIILLKRYESKSDLRKYLVFMLPVLTTYYLIHHLKEASSKRFLAAYNLLRGVIAGITFKEPETIFQNHVRQNMQSSMHAESSLAVTCPLVSVIIPCKDSGKTIGSTLRSLEQQTYRNLEIIVVDNFSTDNTLAIAKSFPRVKTYQIGPERSSQVNYGVSMSLGRYVYRVDSDFIVEPETIYEAVKTCQTHGYQVVTVHNTSDPTISFWSAVRKLERDCYEDDNINIAARFFDREAFRSVKGFDESLIAAEDYDLHDRLVEAGFKVARIRSKEIHISEPRSLRDIVETHFFYGTKISEFVRKNPKVSIRQISPARTAFIRHWRYFLKDPRLTVGFLVYQYVRYASAMIGYLSTKF